MPNPRVAEKQENPMQIFTIMVRSCMELFEWPVRNYIWFLDMVESSTREDNSSVGKKTKIDLFRGLYLRPCFKRTKTDENTRKKNQIVINILHHTYKYNNPNN